MKSILGIDLGTSSVKLLQRFEDGTIKKVRETYKENNPASWKKAIKNALNKLELSSVAAIGLSSQVGTYVIDDENVINWYDPEGQEELKKIKRECEAEQFLKEISMPHPNIHSYPMPRLLYIKKCFPEFQKVCQPKDLLCEWFTGNRVTDPYSWRGLANLEAGAYSAWALQYLGIEEEQLPKMKRPTETSGTWKLEGTGICKGTPVYVGCNDFFAGLIGMGVQNHIFDITGTSEHIGVISKTMVSDTEMVSGPYFQDYVHYGVTASSGVSMEFCMQHFMQKELLQAEEIEDCLQGNPPIFLPYLKGERAPIWDANAEGTFFGIHQACEGKHLAYAVMEGIVFSLWHIYTYLGEQEAKEILVTGGGAENRVLNTLKAELFQMPVLTLEEKDTSALGAVMLAAVGSGQYKGLKEAADKMCKVKQKTLPCGQYRDRLLKRFAIYQKLYPALRELFAEKKSLL